MTDTKRRVGPVLARVLKCFESQAELGRQAGVDRFVVRYWTRLGYIPTNHALAVAGACAAVGGKVGIGELLREAELGRARVVERGGARVVRLVSSDRSAAVVTSDEGA